MLLDIVCRQKHRIIFVALWHVKHKLWLKENIEIEEEEKDVIGDDQTTLQYLWLSNVNKRRIRESDLVVIDLIYITTEMCIIHNFSIHFVGKLLFCCSPLCNLPLLSCILFAWMIRVKAIQEVLRETSATITTRTTWVYSEV